MSTNLLSAAELAQMQTDLEAVTLPDTCTILTIVSNAPDGEGGMVETWDAAALTLNDGFETAGAGGADIFGSWTEAAGDGAIADEGTIVHGGAHAAKLTCGATAWTTSLNQQFTVVPGAPYVIEIWMRGDGTNAGYAAVSNAAGDAYLVAVTAGTTGAAYVKTTLNFTAIAGETHAHLLLFSPITNGGVAYFDDVSVLRTMTPVACRLDAQGGGESDVARSLEPYATFVLTVPHDTTLDVGYRIVHGGYTYAVTAVDDDSSWPACLRATLEWIE